MMKNRRKGSVLSWGVFGLWCTVVILCFVVFTFSTLRLLFTGFHFHPTLVSKWNIPAMGAVSSENPATPAISIRETVIFPDQALIFLKYPPSSSLFTKDAINCTYHSSSRPELQLYPLLSLDFDGQRSQQIVRCPIPPRGAIASLTVNGHNLTPGATLRWDFLAYDAVIDQDNMTVVFVKGLNLRSGRAANPSKFKCIYGPDLNEPRPVLEADVVSAAQEIVRCKTPQSILNRADDNDPIIKVSVRIIGKRRINSIARVSNNNHDNDNDDKLSPNVHNNNRKEHEVCVCTMLRNQARFLPEWITYHARVGVGHFFIYDNNSDDDIEPVLGALTGLGHNVTRRPWPWIKTQEAGFARCALEARGSCEWVGFIDVDEFLHLPAGLTLHDVVHNPDRPDDVAELRVGCHSFGPSGLKAVPARGVSVGYTCRMTMPERHKSIVRPEALSPSLINVVHHFELGRGYRHANVNRSVLVINHYKYQVWEVFKEKFYRRVATYVSDWQQERNVGSKDRAPGLGTKPVEPSDWSTRFCEVRDTGLRDRVLEMFTRETGSLPWENRVDVRSKT